MYRSKNHTEGGLMAGVISTIFFCILCLKPATVTQSHCNEFEDCLLKILTQQDLKGVPPEYILAVAELETGFGNGTIYKQNHNLFSIKIKSNGVCHNSSCYRKYTSDDLSIKDYVRLITTVPNYHMAYSFALLDEHTKFFQALQNSGYAEDKKYAQKIERIFKRIKCRQAASRITQHKVLVNYCNNGSIG